MNRTEFRNLAGVSRIETRKGMPSIQIERDGLRGEVYLHGAQVTNWKPPSQQENVLFLSEKSQFRADKAIRGGVPICFPWFGPHPDGLPQHGFARTRTWHLEIITEEDDAIVAELSDRSDEKSRSMWPFEFVARHRIAFGNTLKMELTVVNSDDKPFRFEEAQHTYFRVGEVQKVTIAGLEGAKYPDNANSGASVVQSGGIKFAGEVDRAYLDTNNTIELIDPSLNRRITVVKSNSQSTVVWNPWVQKASALADLGADQWKQMVCIETCNIRSNAISIAPGESHTMTTEIKVETL